MASFGRMAIVLIVIALLVIIIIEWMRQNFAIGKYWTDKQTEAYRLRKRTGK
jgi:uncharacterized membrane protein YwzB